jgi:hypothetical protein
MRRKSGYSLVGSTPKVVVPNIRTRNISVCATMTTDGLKGFEISESAFNTLKFLDFLRSIFQSIDNEGLGPCVFIMDNVRFHKTAEIHDLFLVSIHEVIYLPPYSPFLNCIENVFSKWKNYVRMSMANNEHELNQNINEGARLIFSVDCEGCFRNMMGYLRRCINEEVIFD